MSSTATYNGIREVNAFYQSVIEEVTVGLQTLFEDEKEEERNRLHAGTYGKGHLGCLVDAPDVGL